MKQIKNNTVKNLCAGALLMLGGAVGSVPLVSTILIIAGFGFLLIEIEGITVFSKKK